MFLDCFNVDAVNDCISLNEEMLCGWRECHISSAKYYRAFKWSSDTVMYTGRRDVDIRSVVNWTHLLLLLLMLLLRVKRNKMPSAIVVYLARWPHSRNSWITTCTRRHLHDDAVQQRGVDEKHYYALLQLLIDSNLNYCIHVSEMNSVQYSTWIFRPAQHTCLSILLNANCFIRGWNSCFIWQKINGKTWNKFDFSTAQIHLQLHISRRTAH